VDELQAGHRPKPLSGGCSPRQKLTLAFFDGKKAGGCSNRNVVIEETQDRRRRVQSDLTLVAQQECAIPTPFDWPTNLSKNAPGKISQFFGALPHIKGYRLNFSGGTR